MTFLAVKEYAHHQAYLTLVSGGYCFLLMALFYYVIDYKGYNKGLN